MKTYMHCCIYHEHNSPKIHWNENLSTKFVQKRDAHILCSINTFCNSNFLHTVVFMILSNSIYKEHTVSMTGIHHTELKIKISMFGLYVGGPKNNENFFL